MLSRLLTVREQWLLLGLAGAIVLGAGVLVWSQPPSSVPKEEHYPVRENGGPPRQATIAPALEAIPEVPPATPERPQKIAVGIQGAVEREGLYYFESGARLSDLLEAAGGVLPESDLSDINRTALLIDETTLLVPEWIDDGGGAYSYPATTFNPAAYTRSTWYRQEGPESTSTPTATQSGSPAATSASGMVNINTASQSELESLPGVGPATAQKIITYREAQPFNAPEDLENVSGIGPAKMAAVRGLITVN